MLLKSMTAGALVGAVCAMSAAPAAAADIDPADVRPAEATTLAAATGLPIPSVAVPKAPGPAWGFSVGVSTRGITVRGVSGYARLTGLIRWNRSYEFSANITDQPFNGGRISAGGTIAGSDIFAPLPLSGLVGSLTGPIAVGPNLSILGGAVSWTAKGFEFSGGLRLGCSTGSLDATARGLFVDEDDFSLSALGQASACTIGPAGRLDGRTFWADLASVNGSLTLTSGVSIARLNLFTLPLGPTRISTYLANVGGSFGLLGRDLVFGFKGAGGADIRTSGLPTLRLKASVAGKFVLRGVASSKLAVTVTGATLGGIAYPSTGTLASRLSTDVATAFSTP